VTPVEYWKLWAILRELGFSDPVGPDFEESGVVRSPNGAL
jgi:hypothetical protein